MDWSGEPSTWASTAQDTISRSHVLRTKSALSLESDITGLEGTLVLSSFIPLSLILSSIKMGITIMT